MEQLNDNTTPPLWRFSLLGVFILILSMVMSGCGSEAESDGSNEASRFTTTIPPLQAIVSEVVGDAGEVHCLLPPGRSPHSFSPTPREAAAAQNSLAVFGISEDLEPWTRGLPDGKYIPLFESLPEEYHRETAGMECTLEGHDHGHHHHDSVVDPHFWMNPMAVQALLPGLVQKLAEIDPDHAGVYKKNADAFSTRLDELDEKAVESLFPHQGEAILLFHPSVVYLLDQYNLEYIGSIQTSPGKEPSPSDLKELVELVKEHHIKALFTEPQLPRHAAEIMAENLGIPLYTLDPLGGIAGRSTYEELIMYNVQTLKEALQ